MCGIAGKLYLDDTRTVDPRRLDRMMDTMAHRGPDGRGQYVAGPVGLGHLRLSIIDLATGAQPLSNEDGSVWITFNGEIYNFAALRQTLLRKGHVFRSRTDTEVIVHLWEEYGEACLDHLQGMFAFAIWDAGQRVLFLARDRVGIKPLYYCRTDTALLFASEIKALLADGDVAPVVDEASIRTFLTYRYVPGSQTLFRNIRKLEPGHSLLVRAGKASIRQYWDLSFSAEGRWKNLDEAAEDLNGLMKSTVAAHMMSDVPVGFLASGGVDSTALLSYAVENAQQPIQTFTVGFPPTAVVDERPYARLAAEQFSTVHREITVSAGEFAGFLPKYVWHMEEPVCEPPAVALYYVSQLARQHVKVLLSGEGGDEAFGGYPEYRNYVAFERGKQVTSGAHAPIRLMLNLASRLRRFRRLRKYAGFMDVNLRDYYYSRTASPADYFATHANSLWAERFAPSAGAPHAAAVTHALFDKTRTEHPLHRMLYVDSKTWLPDDLLIKADRMTMATSLELRVPFLDHRVLEFAAALPPHFKVRGHQTKRVLRQAFRGRIPSTILARRKAGFPVPYATWLTGELREFVRETILSTRALSRGYFRRQGLEAVLGNGDGASGLAPELFSLLILELWHRQFVDAPPRTDLAETAPTFQVAGY